MKIFQISTFFHPVTGGVETHVYQLTLELLAKGYEVEVLCSDSAKKRKRVSEKHSVVNGINITRFRSWFGLSYYHKFYPGLFWYLMKHDFDIAHVHGFRKFETYIAMFACFLKRKKIVLTTHNPFPTSTRSRFANFLIKFHDLTFGWLFTRRINHIITLVKSENIIFNKKFGVNPNKLSTIPNGVDSTFYTKGNADQFFKDWNIEKEKWSSIVCWGGRVSYAKGIQNLKTAIAGLPNSLFFFAGGDDGYLTKLKFQFAEYKNVLFAERFLPSEKLNDMYAASDVFVFPSLHEAFGIMPIEALAAGCPVISTNVGGPAEILNTQVAIIQNPVNQQAWLDNIKNLVENTQLREQMSEAGKQFAQEFAWPKVTTKIIEVYEHENSRRK